MLKRTLLAVVLVLALILSNYNSEDYADVKEQIKQEEGLRLKPYDCSRGYTTIGYGHNLDTRGITQEWAERLLDEDFQDAVDDLKDNILRGRWDDLPYPVQSTLINMRYQLGHTGLLGFTKMLEAVKTDNWVGMVTEMRDSLWYTQTTNRAESMIQNIREGV